MTTTLHRLRNGAGLVLILGAAGAAFAQSPASTLADCHGIASGLDRLACYDSISRRSAGSQAVPVTPATPAAAVPAGSTAAVQARSSMIDDAWNFDPASPRYDIRYFRSNYLLVGRYTDSVNTAPYTPFFEAAGKEEGLDATEAKFQISFKGRLWTTDDRRWGVWAAYTQQNQWQLYNDDISRPFRETNYMPEVFVSYRPDVDLPGGFRWGLVNFGFNHQSNGRTDVLSRSWNRLIAEAAVERGDLVLTGKLWYRLEEDEEDDDNPDITDYLGHAEIGALYRWRGHSFAVSGRGNVNTGKGAVQATWTSPPFLGPLRGYVQLFSGYGESLIDYNWNQTTIGVGIALSDGM